MYLAERDPRDIEDSRQSARSEVWHDTRQYAVTRKVLNGRGSVGDSNWVVPIVYQGILLSFVELIASWGANQNAEIIRRINKNCHTADVFE